MTLEAVWFVLVVAAFVAYVVLDGFDLGAGIVSRWVASTSVERRVVAHSIGPVWDGNEVWLLAAGATIFLAFPKLYAVGISGFYLPITMLLWLYVGRALGIEMKHHLTHPVWDDLWDAAFGVSSVLIAFALGVALGNVVRGVDFDPRGRFFLPLFTTLLPRTPVGVLDVYTVGVGLLSVSALGLHGSLWLAHRTSGDVATRAERIAPRLLRATSVLAALAGAGTFATRPDAAASLAARPWAAVFPVAAALALFAVAQRLRGGDARGAFRGSAAFLASMLATAAATIYPFVLPSRPGGAGLSVTSARADDYALGVALAWWIPGMILAAAYFVSSYRRLPERVGVDDVSHST